MVPVLGLVINFILFLIVYLFNVVFVVAIVPILRGIVISRFRELGKVVEQVLSARVSLCNTRMY